MGYTNLIHLDSTTINLPFIEYYGNVTTNFSGNITTVKGGGSIVGPKEPTLTEHGYSFAGMVKVRINGRNYRMPYYMEETPTGL
jgi:hypothetical protein